MYRTKNVTLAISIGFVAAFAPFVLSADEAASKAISLAGQWNLRLDPSDEGIDQRWFEAALPGRVHLPGSLTAQGFGDDVGVATKWTGRILDPSWFKDARYAPYRKPGNIKVPFWLQPNKHYIGPAWYEREVVVPADWQGKLQTLLYKEDIEASLRTPGFGGFQLLDLHDFPGQGTALVGVLDPFWEEKGYVTPADYHRFCCETVPLLRMKKCVYTSDETFTATVEIAHFGPAPIKKAQPVWTVAYPDGRKLAEGSLPERDLPLGNGTALGTIEQPLAGAAAPTQLIVTVSLKGTPYSNHWDIWVYPTKLETAPPTDVLVVESLDKKTEEALAAGKRVLLLAPPATIRSDVPPGFSVIFWNTAWTGRQPPHTLGLLCNPEHPALAKLPTEFHSNWQWWDLVSKSRAMILDDFPTEFRPIIQVIDDWTTNRKLGLVFEVKTGGGRLLVCSIDLRSNLENRPVARQMLRSLLDYAHGDAFAPRQDVGIDVVRNLLKD